MADLVKLGDVRTLDLMADLRDDRDVLLTNLLQAEAIIEQNGNDDVKNDSEEKEVWVSRRQGLGFRVLGNRTESNYIASDLYKA